ncbi:hypothetical protein ACHAQH_007223 [Verticillium albo-atrum]
MVDSACARKLLIASFYSFIPQYVEIISRRDFTGISPTYVFFNLLATTAQFALGLHWTVVNEDVGDTIVHTPPTAGDFLNLCQFGIVWVCHVYMFLLYLWSHPSDPGNKVYLSSLYGAILVAAFAPIALKTALGTSRNDVKHQDRGWLSAMYGGAYVLLINRAATALVALSFLPQAWLILSRDCLGVLSLDGLSFQAVAFIVVGVAWSYRISFEQATCRHFRYWYATVGWAAVDNVAFGVVQGLLFLLALGRKGCHEEGGGDGSEVRPFLFP